MKKFFTLILTLIFIIPAFAQDYPGLPQYMTEEEKLIGNNYYSFPPINPIPPSTPVRTMAEWEELDGIIITWTSYSTLLRQIADAAQEEGMVWIICSDSNSVKSQLQAGGVPLYNIAFVVAPYNSVWSRDYGPWSVYTVAGDTLGFVDFKYNRPRPLDDIIPGVLAQRWNVPLYQTISGRDSLSHTGGNYMVDGFGTSFRSRLTEQENPKTTLQIDSVLFRYCGIPIGRSVSMTVLPYDGIHHIDMHMKILDEETIMVGQYPLGVADGPQIEANIQHILNNYLNCYGRPYKIVRIPMPPSPSGQYPPSSYYYTYTNSTFVNKTILVPIYGLPLDTTALRIYRENLPGYTVIGLDCNAPIPSGGAIHCINKEIGTKNPVLIYHAKLQNTNDSANNYLVQANIKNRSGIDSAFVYWSTDTSFGYNRAIMTNTSGNNWNGYIPKQNYGKTVYYYIRTRTSSGKYFSKPMTAPKGHWKFNVGGITGLVTNEMIPGSFKLEQNYPNPFNPVTRIRFEVPNFQSFTLSGGQNIKIIVYDVQGRHVTTLINEKMAAGAHEVEWNAINNTSGIYFYSLIINDMKADTKKMILVK